MEKYGVAIDNKDKDGVKTAVRNDQEKRNSNVPISDLHGTKPWEKKPMKGNKHGS